MPSADQEHSLAPADAPTKATAQREDETRGGMSQGCQPPMSERRALKDAGERFDESDRAART